MDRFKKQPYEEFTVSSDFAPNFSRGETIAGQSVSVLDAAGNDVSATITDQATVANNGASKVTVLVRAGSEASSPYKITFRCITTANHRWENDIQMSVREI